MSGISRKIKTSQTRSKRIGASANDLRVQHGTISEQLRETDAGPVSVQFDDAESPLAWLARRRDRNGRTMIDATQFAAGERLRADFTRAGMTPRVTANWISPVAQGRRSGGDSHASFADAVIAAKERMNHALKSAGPEFSGLLLDVCCFLKGLETVERERGWPQRAAKVVLCLALDRLARHYGLAAEVRGPGHAPMRSWQAEGARPVMGGS